MKYFPSAIGFLLLTAAAFAADPMTDAERECNIHLKKICLAFFENAADGASFPDRADGLGVLLKNGTVNPALFVCPGSGRPVPAENSWHPDQADYLYFGDIPSRVYRVPLLIEKPDVHPNGFACLFRDGRVVRFSGPCPTMESEVRAAAGNAAGEPEWSAFLDRAREWDRVHPPAKPGPDNSRN